MSNTIYCNTVVINNHTPKPTYKEILASPYDQPTIRAAQVPFYPNRSPLDCKRPNNDRSVRVKNHAEKKWEKNLYGETRPTTTTTTTTMVIIILAVAYYTSILYFKFSVERQ